MRGLQRGASSFSTSSGVAIVELLGRALHTVQVWRREEKDREEGRDVNGGRKERGAVGMEGEGWGWEEKEGEGWG